MSSARARLATEIHHGRTYYVVYIGTLFFSQWENKARAEQDLRFCGGACR